MSFRHIYIITTYLNHGLMSCQTSTRGHQASGHTSLPDLTRCLPGTACPPPPNSTLSAFPPNSTFKIQHYSHPPPIQHSTFKIQHYSHPPPIQHSKFHIQHYFHPPPIQHSTFKIQHYPKFTTISNNLISNNVITNDEYSLSNCMEESRAVSIIDIQHIKIIRHDGNKTFCIRRSGHRRQLYRA